MFNVKMTSNNILQGKYFLGIKNKYNKKNIKLIEGMTGGGNDDETPLEDPVESILKTSEDYKSTLNDYQTQYEKYIRERMATGENDLKNKTIKYNNNLYYVNNHNVYRQIDIPEDQDVDTFLSGAIYPGYNCGTPEVVDDRIFQSLTKGEYLKRIYDNDTEKFTFEKCTDDHVVQGDRMIMDIVNSKKYWLDHLGKKHAFVNDSEIHSTCTTDNSTLEVNGAKSRLITTAETKKKASDECIKKSATKTKIDALNNKLKEYAKTIQDHVITRKNQGSNLDKSIESGKKEYEEKLKQLENNRKQIKSLKKEIFSLDGNVRDNYLNVKSLNLNYLAWGVSLVTFVGITIMMSKK